MYGSPSVVADRLLEQYIGDESQEARDHALARRGLCDDAQDLEQRLLQPCLNVWRYLRHLGRFGPCHFVYSTLPSDVHLSTQESSDFICPRSHWADDGLCLQ